MASGDAIVDIPLNKIPPSITATDPGDKKDTTLDQDADQDPVLRSQYRGRRKSQALSRKSTYSVLTNNEGDDDDVGDKDEEDAPPTLIGRIVKYSAFTRFALYIIPMSILLTIPIILTETVFHNAAIGDIRLSGLFVWIQIVWLSCWLAALIAYTLPFLCQFLGGYFTSNSRWYTQLLRTVILPMSVFFWALFSRAATPVICAFDIEKKYRCDDPWVLIIQKALLATIAVTGMFFVEKLLVHLLSVRHRHRQFDSKIKEGRRITHILSLMFHKSRKFFPAHCSEFATEDQEIFSSSNLPAGGRPNSGRFSVGHKFSSAMRNAANRFTGKEVLKSGSSQSIVLRALETEAASEALARRLWMSFVAEGEDQLYEKDIAEMLGKDGEADANEIFTALDKDCNGDVSLSEMLLLVLQVGRDRRAMERSLHDIGKAIKSLDHILCLVVLVLTVLVYVAFFSPALASRTTTLWAGVAGASFAIAGTAQEFLGSCIFLFVKHPYDVGDRVEINSIGLIVEHISLMYTVFRQLDSEAITQIPNIVNNGAWIKNISRSTAMKETYKFCISAKTKFPAIELLKAEMQSFVLENKRDYQAAIDVEVLSLGSLKELELQVEICHKSNWSNEALRSTRRSKFICALLAALRKFSISAPGGGGEPPVGSWENPGYSVTVSDEEALAARDAWEKREEEKKAKQLNPDAFPPEDEKGKEKEEEAKVISEAVTPTVRESGATSAADVVVKRTQTVRRAATLTAAKNRRREEEVIAEAPTETSYAAYPQAGDEYSSFTGQSEWEAASQPRRAGSDASTRPLLRPGLPSYPSRFSEGASGRGGPEVKRRAMM
ncbi:hypothetical protein GJ744_001936 [Endocarpon pusillum]|uniref:Mechanosensitive ion channel protein n=1 Tax=Endocarpon pusillum TaxID=364733 RepID=A0A8H7E8Q3_9EURO|nr:hypothetical protein GJ744_001936 [Endocarpon pusillum]